MGKEIKLGAAISGGVESSPFLVNGLRVDDAVAPMGIDDTNLRFTWRLVCDARGMEQTAFRLLIATRADLLTAGAAEVWDSGRRNVRAQHVDCNIPALRGKARYWWKVGVWDGSGAYVESEAACFDTGLFPDDWSAQWIWSSRRVRVNDFACLRKEFQLKKTVVYAKMFVSAHHVMQVHVNGECFGGFGSPAPSHPAKRKYYTAYDVTSALRTGGNCIAAIAHYLGGGGQNYVDGMPGFRMQLEVTYADGTSQTIRTDATWQALKDIPHAVGTSYQQNRRMTAIEDYDARKLDPAWLQAGFDKALCRKAALAKIGPGDWPMRWQRIPEGEEEEAIVPTRVTTIEALRDGRYRAVRMAAGPDAHDEETPIHQPEMADAYHEEGQSLDANPQVFDAGKIVSGWPRFALEGIEGVTLRLRYSEDLDEHGRVKHNVCNEISDRYFDQYTMRGDAVEIWQPDLSYKAFRYVEVTGYPKPIVPGDNLWVISAHTGMRQEGAFRCSNEMLNAMYDASMQTQKNNTLGQTVDCPHREQAQYLADSDLQAEALLYNFDSRHVLEKVVSDFADAQLADGTFPFVFPSNYDNPDFFLQIPEWDLHYCTLLWKTYGASGDLRVLERHYEPAKRMADYYVSIVDPRDGLVPIDKGWHISDWPYPTVDHASDYLTVQNMKLYQALRIVADTASLLGRNEDRKAYARIAEVLKKNIVKRLYNPALKLFHDSLGSEHTHQGVNALALHADLVPQEDRQAAIDAVAAMPWESKTVLSLPLLRVLFENGREEDAYRLISRTEYPGWGYMIEQGATTMWEGWDDIESHCHAWNGYPVRLLQEYVAGIQSLAPGFAEVRIKPYMPDGLAFAEASVPTPFGVVNVHWERGQLDGGSELAYRIQVEIPAGMRAWLVLPVADPTAATISESDVAVWHAGSFSSDADGIARGLEAEGGISFELGSGSFVFTVI